MNCLHTKPYHVLLAALLLLTILPLRAQEPALKAISQVVKWSDLTLANGWIIDAVGNPARLEQKAQAAAAADPVLSVTPLSWKEDHVRLVRAVRWELDGISALSIDVYDESGVGWIAFGFRNDVGQPYYQTQSVQLKRGWNRDVVVQLELWQEGEKPGEAAPTRASDLGLVRQLYLLLGRRQASTAPFALANLRALGDASTDWTQTVPRIETVTASGESVVQYELFELAVRFSGTFKSCFDMEEVKLEVQFSGPQDSHYKALGFYAGAVQTAGATRHVWKVRFTPTLPGQWLYSVEVSTKGGRSQAVKGGFMCTQDVAKKGFVRRSKLDQRYFEFDSGAFFYPLGMNVAWASDYDYYFRKLHEADANWARIWLCPWSLWLEPKPGQFDLTVAERLDRIVALAEKYNIYVQLVFEYHGMLTSESWSKNPYNKLNGGWCTSEGAFFSDEDARKAFKNRLRYAVARWGYSTHVFAWELFNEVDLTYYDHVSDILRWHEEMAALIRSVDPAQHLISTSALSEDRINDVWKLDNIDFVQGHAYADDIAHEIKTACRNAHAFGKPFLMAECGRSSDPVTSWADTDGHHLHEALWAAFLLPAAGGAMPWWWDSVIDANNHYPFWKGLHLASGGIDRRGRNWFAIDRAVPSGSDHELRLRALLDNQICLLWLGASWDAAKHQRRIPAGVRLRFSHMLDGPYEVLWIDPWRGAILSKTTATVADSRLMLEVPPSEDSVACRIVRQPVSPPLVTPESTAK